MDRLSGPSQLMIVSDLDQTMVDHHDPENISLLRFNALWEAYYRHNSLLVFSTGRSYISYKRLRKKKPMLTPDITIMSVGTEIAYGETLIPDDNWDKYLDQKWDRAIVLEETAKFPDLKFQAESEQRPHKVSFFIGKDKAQEVMKTLSERLQNRGIEVKQIYSGGEALDFLPQGAGKGQALAYILERLSAEGKRPVNTLVCGDSGNDAELYSIPNVHGVVVNNAMEELLQWYTENAKNNPKIIHANERCAAGIIQAIGHFKLGLDKSPRDIMDFSEDKIENIHPGHEVVKFYTFYERWRRAEVENSKHYMKILKKTWHPSGVFVHPSGVEQPLYDCIDAMQKSYGDKQGKHFRVWVDRVSAAQIGSGAWLVKFDKWESSEEGPRCCLVTALLSSESAVSVGFSWVHVHQTWLDGYEAEDKNLWLF